MSSEGETREGSNRLRRQRRRLRVRPCDQPTACPDPHFNQTALNCTLKYASKRPVNRRETDCGGCLDRVTGASAAATYPASCCNRSRSGRAGAPQLAEGAKDSYNRRVNDYAVQNLKEVACRASPIVGRRDAAGLVDRLTTNEEDRLR